VRSLNAFIAAVTAAIVLLTAVLAALLPARDNVGFSGWPAPPPPERPLSIEPGDASTRPPPGMPYAPSSPRRPR